jgi:ABC-type phosphate transport system substrate-binding protein
MKKVSRVGAGVIGVLALVLTQATAAHADPQAQGADVVGVGSDTTQFAHSFLSDGDCAGDLGFNNGSLLRRMYSYDASGDANGRITNPPPATPGTQVVLRAGSAPITRPNGSGAGRTALLNDKVQPFKVDFARTSAAVPTSEGDTARAQGWGGLHVYQVGLDGMQMAVSNLVTTNAGTSGVSINDLVQIYSATGTIRTWGQVTGYNGPNPGATIKALIPQTGSGTRSFFQAQLNAAAGATVTIRSDAINVEEHDPAPIQSDADAIAPFSTARLALIHAGFFNAAAPCVPLATDPVKLQAPPTNPNAFATTRPVFVVVRQCDVVSNPTATPATGCPRNTTVDPVVATSRPFPWSGVGGSCPKNWVQTLFTPANVPNTGCPAGFLARSINASPLVSAAGFQYQYADLGVV